MGTGEIFNVEENLEQMLVDSGSYTSAAPPEFASQFALENRGEKEQATGCDESKLR